MMTEKLHNAKKKLHAGLANRETLLSNIKSFKTP